MNTASCVDSATARPLSKVMIGWFVDKPLAKPADAAEPRLEALGIGFGFGLAAAVEGIDAIVFTHGPDGRGEADTDERIGGVRNVLVANARRPLRIALMTAIAVPKGR